MFLASTALTEFWDEEDELLFLGSWCRPHEKAKQWRDRRGRLMPKS